MGNVEVIISQYGVEVEWLKLQNGQYVSQGKIKAVIQPAAADEFFLEPGYAVSDHLKVYTTAELGYKDRIVFKGKTWEVLAPYRYESELLGEKFTQAVVRRLLT
jgi:hypothetical protein